MKLLKRDRYIQYYMKLIDCRPRKSKKFIEILFELIKNSVKIADSR